MSRPFLIQKNMYRLTDIQDALFHLVGWEQDFNPSAAIDTELTQTESGLYYQNAHPLMTLENIRSVMPDEFSMQYPQWNLITTYREGQKVMHGGVVWIARRENQGSEPPASDFNGDFSADFGGEDWRAYNFFSDYLTRLTRQGIATMVQTFMEEKGLNKETKNLLERRTFFDGAGRLTATENNRGRIVGFEIVPVRAMGVTTRIERIGLQMTGATGNVRVYLFHSSQTDPIKTFDLNFTKTNGGFQWFDISDCYLPYISSANDAGGSWYLCYNQNDLPVGMQAINVSKDWSREPCGTCNIGDLAIWRELTKYIQISPFCQTASQTFAEFPELWDIAFNAYTNTKNYGLNVEVSVGCDLTDFIIQQKHLFQTVLQKQVASIALRTMAMNPSVRVNRNQSNVDRMDVLYELDGNTASNRPQGLGAELKNAYKALSLDTRGIDRICLTCNNGGVKYTTV